MLIIELINLHDFHFFLTAKFYYRYICTRRTKKAHITEQNTTRTQCIDGTSKTQRKNHAQDIQTKHSRKKGQSHPTNPCPAKSQQEKQTETKKPRRSRANRFQPAPKQLDCYHYTPQFQKQQNSNPIGYILRQSPRSKHYS